MRKEPLLYRAVEWEVNGYWHVADTSDITGISMKWWVIPRLLDLTPADYIVWLLKNYEPDVYTWGGRTFYFCWSKENYHKAHNFLEYINKIAKEKGFKV